MSWRAEEVVCRTFCFSKAWICLPSAQPHSPTEFKHNSRVKQLSSTSRIRGCSPIVYHLFVPNPYSNDQLERLCFWYHNFSSLLAKSLWFSSPLTLHISKDQLKHPFLSHRMLFGKHCSNTFWRVTFYHFISPSLQSKNYGWKTQRKMLSEDAQWRFLLSFNPSFSISAAHLNVSSCYVSNQPCTVSHVMG